MNKYLVDYYKDGELVLENRGMPNMFLAKTNGLMLEENDAKTRSPRANAMRVFHCKPDGTRGRELGFYIVGPFGNWNKAATKNAHRPDDPIYEENVQQRLQFQKNSAITQEKRREEERRYRREIEAERLKPKLKRFVNFAGGAHDLDIPSLIVEDFLAAVREGTA